MSNLRISKKKKTADPIIILLPHGLIIAKALVFEINVSYLLQYLKDWADSKNSKLIFVSCLLLVLLLVDTSSESFL